MEVLWRRTEAERGITASEVRTCIEKGENWQQLVPRTVYEYVLSHGIDQRIREYAKKGFATAEEL